MVSQGQITLLISPHKYYLENMSLAFMRYILNSIVHHPVVHRSSFLPGEEENV